MAMVRVFMIVLSLCYLINDCLFNHIYPKMPNKNSHQSILSMAINND
ncbi:hypothetical protein [Moraxella lacunata]